MELHLGTNIYEKIGGAKTVSKIVRKFYDIVLSDDILKKYFENISMASLIGHQIEFISSALGKPAEYMGRTIVEAHKGLNITNAEFNHICKILNSVLREEGIDDQYIKQIELIVLSLKNEIVGH